jgi:hypothetical protein
MVWVRLEDEFPDHPKVDAAGPLASWLFVTSLCYANKHLTNGFISESRVKRLADLDDPLAAAKRLVQVGLWEVAKGGYQIHDYHGYQPSAEEVKRERDENAARVAGWRRRKREAEQAAAGKEVRNGVTEPSRNAVRTGAPVPVPVNPVNPVPVRKSSADDFKAREARKTPAAFKNQPWNDESIYGPIVTVEGMKT